MRRKIKNDILNFLNQDAKKKALLVTGARQIGKTYIIRECIKETKASFVEINFIENKEAKKLFSDFKNTRDFFLRLSAFTEGELIKGETIIFLDEVQELIEYPLIQHQEGNHLIHIYNFLLQPKILSP